MTRYVAKPKNCRDSPYATTNVIYLVYCRQCAKYGASSFIEWKPLLKNYTNLIKERNPTCQILKHFMY